MSEETKQRDWSLNDIIDIAHEAGEATLEYYDEDYTVFQKDDDSPLTKADLAAHHVIFEALKELTPEIPVISEEGGIPSYDERKKWERFWIVDPLDGTKEFIKHNGEFTINIALIDAGEPVLGVVYVPAKEITYYAEKGKGSFKQQDGQEPQRIFSEPADKEQPLTIVESRSHASKETEQYLEEEGVKVGERIPAGSSLKFCLVAEGKADIYPRLGPTMEWDVAAGDCVYRNSAPEGQHKSTLSYNKENLRNKEFVIGW